MQQSQLKDPAFICDPENNPLVSLCCWPYLLQVRHMPTEPVAPKEGWPATWRHSTGGRIGLALLGISFCIATCIQLQGVLTKQWHRDYRWGGTS